MSEERSNPEVFLERIQRENQERVRGHLKIFFGYAAGVGKTYAMLEAAQAAKLQGVDVVAGYIEPHTRPQTMALLRGSGTAASPGAGAQRVCAWGIRSGRRYPAAAAG